MTNKKTGQNRTIALLLAIGFFICDVDFSFCIEAPFSEERASIDRLINLALQNDKKSNGLSGLKQIIEDSNQPEYTRSYAIERLSELRIPELKQYLLDIAVNRNAVDAERVLRNPAYLAYWKITISLEPDQAKRTQLLISALDAHFEGLIATNVQSWAVEELCETGALDLLPMIADSIKSRIRSDRATYSIEFCRKRMEILNKYPDRLTAYDHALYMDDTLDRQPMKEWAILGLGSLKSEQANTVLADYAVKRQQESEEPVKLLELIAKVLLNNGWSKDQILSHGIESRFVIEYHD